MPIPFLPWVERSLLAVFGIFLFAGILVSLVAMKQGWEKMTRRALRRAASMLIVLGLFGLLLYALNYERVYALGMRFGFVLWAVLFGWYAWRLVKFVRVEIPQMEQRRAEREATNKWLPKSKT